MLDKMAAHSDTFGSDVNYERTRPRSLFSLDQIVSELAAKTRSCSAVYQRI